MKLSDMSFREIYKKCVIITEANVINSLAQMVVESASFSLASEWDSALCYCYIDEEIGVKAFYIAKSG